MLIRHARLSDVPEIAQIHVDSWKAAFGISQSPTYDQRLELWHHVLGGGPRRNQVWVALDDLGRLIGFASAGVARVLKARFDGEVTAIYVAPAFQGQGAGSALLTEVFGWFKSKEFRSAMAWVPKSGSAPDFFIRRGAEALADTRVTRSGTAAMTEVALSWPRML
jgi:L-amino acid N-acyltransferase YncA